MYRDFFGTQAESIFNANVSEEINEERHEGEVEVQKNEGRILTNADDYCQIHDTDRMPEISNEFILDYYDKNPPQDIPRNEIIELTQRFCEWLFKNSYTSSKLSLLEEWNAN